MLYIEYLKELEKISQAVGIPVDYTQGGGGNTSVKLNKELMAVKASGFKLKQITSCEGYVVVNYRNIMEYYEQVDLSQDRDFEKESSEFVRNSIVETEGLKKLRPSVEAGFHSILKKYVIHTHPVYANILCCEQNGKELVERIFHGKQYSTAWIPYINPGFRLTLKIKDSIKASMEAYGKFPQVIFMENHGLIVTDDDADRCISLHKNINDTIKLFFDFSDEFPKLNLCETDDQLYLGKTEYIRDFIKKNEITGDYFEKYVLYPDQLVYLNGNVSINGMGRKVNIDTVKGEIIYRTGRSEAETIEETLLAYFYILNGIKDNGLTLKTMTVKEIDFIRNWESEAYRRSLAKGI